MTNRGSIVSIFRKILMVGLVAALCAAPAMAADQDFTLHNNTGRVMKALFVAPTSTDTWGSDILGEDTLAAGADLAIKFDRNESECKWDVRAEFEDGSYGEVRDVDFCSVTDVTFNAGE
jgi:hypothetical protein